VSIKKLLLVFVGLFVLFSVGGIVMALIAGHPIDFEKQMAENFYYAAIAFAVYHIFTRKKLIQEAREKKEAADRAAADDQVDEDDESPDAENRIATDTSNGEDEEKTDSRS